MAKRPVRVVIPRKAEELLDLGEGIIAEHTANPVNNPLNALDMADFAAKVAASRTKQDEAMQLRLDSETATQDRDDLLGLKKEQSSATDGTVLNYVTRSRDILLGVHKGKEQHLGDYTFKVDDSPKAKKGGSTPVPPTPPVVQTGSVNVTVVNANTLMPLGGATVELVGRPATTTTDPSGKATMGGVPVGAQTVRASLAGYGPLEKPVTVVANASLEATLMLAPITIPLP